MRASAAKTATSRACSAAVTGFLLLHLGSSSGLGHVGSTFSSSRLLVLSRSFRTSEGRSGLHLRIPHVADLLQNLRLVGEVIREEQLRHLDPVGGESIGLAHSVAVLVQLDTNDPLSRDLSGDRVHDFDFLGLRQVDPVLELVQSELGKLGLPT